ncbi:DUF2058 domain-containing protein [Aggregicoccus sp. 17bor-14]|nr:DUF2058 family protein [Simulacricoccus sp. 17bor-14]MRI89442.1 DUF2058 domain-containing protein [Aggregicoccus sp. 17bor-14]
MQNLRDKLLKAGLVTEDQAKKVETAAPSRPAPSPSRRDEGGAGERGPRREESRGPRRDDHRPRRDEGRGGPPPRREGGRPSFGRPSAPAAPPVPKLPPMPGSREAQRLESKKQQELARALRELVLGNQVPVDVGASVFYFMTRKGKLRRLELTEAQAKQLEEGALAVVERPEPAQIEHSLVPAAAAEKMYALSQKSVRFLNRKDSPIGFMDDSALKAQQEAEAAGTAQETPDDEPEAAGAEPEAAEPEAAAETSEATEPQPS